MGMAVHSDVMNTSFKSILLEGRKVSLEEAIFRSAEAFRPSSLKEHLLFWEQEILRDHPNKVNLLKWLRGVKIEDFLQSFTEGTFQGIPMHSFYPQPQQFDNYYLLNLRTS